MTRGKWLLVIYGVALLLSLIVRKIDRDAPPLPETGGWKMETVTRVGQKVPLAYRELGNTRGRKMLLIHGCPGASGIFDRIIPELEKDFHLFVPDLPGYGFSRTQDLEEISIRSHAEYLSQLLEKRDLREVEVVGYSLGGGVALHLEKLQPNRVKSLVMLSSIGVQEHELLGDYLLNHVIHGLQLTAFNVAYELIPHFGFFERFMLNRNYARNFYETDQRPLREMIEHWDKPLQIIHGKRDSLVPPRAAYAHHRLVPQSRLDWIEKGGHIPLIKRPAEVAALIADGPERKGAAKKDGTKTASFARQRTRIDQTTSGKIFVMSLLGLATFGSEDLSCISGGLLVSRSVVQFSTAAFGCFLGIFLSDIGLFLIGKWFSSRLSRFEMFRKKFESYRVSAGKEWIDKNSAKMIVVSRFIPGSRVPTYVTLGASGLRFSKFTFWMFIAAAIWTPLLVGISSIFGEQILPFLEKNEKLILPGFVVLLVSGAVMIRLLSGLATWRGRRLLLSRWKRTVRWEFWPAWALYLFVLPVMIRKAIEYRSFTVFTAANPGLPCGGFAWEPKLISLNALRPSGNVPAFRKVKNLDELNKFIEDENVSYPLVLKPDAGERGQGVGIVQSEEEASVYMEEVPEDVTIIAQDYAEGKEYGVFYYRYPDQEEGDIYAVTEKKPVEVTGDGKHTLEELILRDKRAVCMAPFFIHQFVHERWDVPGKGEKVAVSKLGTHSRGAIFLDGSHLKTDALRAEIDRITQHFEGFYFGRYDLKVPSEEDLKNGRGIQIIELNGVTSEATSMYDPKHSLREGLAILKQQWEIAYDIGAANRAAGHKPANFGDLRRNVMSRRRLEKFESP